MTLAALPTTSRLRRDRDALYRRRTEQAANLTDTQLANIARTLQGHASLELRPVLLEMAERLGRRPRIERVL